MEVFQKKEVTETIQFPMPFTPGPPGGDSPLPTPHSPLTPFAPGPAGGGSSPWGEATGPGQSPEPAALANAPAFVAQKITRIKYVPVRELEPTLLRQLTVGGVMLVRDPVREQVALERGRLFQTYSGDLPALCPT
ncbi:MAG: hypothetical protein ABSF26_14265 [Thermoguttaceae bacterium]